MLLEGREAIESIDEILEVEGIDVIFLGPVDMSMSLGFPGEPEHPQVEKAIREIADKARRKNIATGMLCMNMESTRRWFQAGIKVMAYGIDDLIISRAVSDIAPRIAAIVTTWAAPDKARPCCGSGPVGAGKRFSLGPVFSLAILEHGDVALRDAHPQLLLARDAVVLGGVDDQGQTHVQLQLGVVRPGRDVLDLGGENIGPPGRRPRRP